MSRRIKDSKLDELGLLDPDEPTESAHLTQRKTVERGVRVWVCVVRREAFVGGESQRCRHSEACVVCEGAGQITIAHSIGGGPSTIECRTCNGSGQVSECGVMELIGGEPVEWCVVHGAELAINKCFRSKGKLVDPCQFESSVRVKVTE